MTVAICHGCGRRASSEEVHCAACGRPLIEGDRTPPPGWMTAASIAEEPLVRPETSAQPVAADLSPEETAALFVPPQARRSDAQTADAEPAEEADATPGSDAEPAGAATVSVPGGHGWRVRVSAAQAAGAAAAETDAAGAVAVRPRRLPRWVFPALLIAILATSAVAAALIVMHVMRSS